MTRRFFANVVFLLLLFGLFSTDSSAFQSSGQASPIPWSGYWWPFQFGALATGVNYRGHPAPLEKYLLLTTGQMTGDAVDWYMNHYYDPDAEAWWGLCPAYARAAVKEAYPIFPSSQDNIVFRVGDKKGLLTLCHDDQSGVIYASGATPVDFHFWLLDYIGAQQKAFTADMDGGEEVWYFPVYGYEMESTPSGLTEQISVVVYYASDNVPPDYIGTSARQKVYTYVLDLDTSGNIVGGRWTGDSILDHPQTLSFPEITGPLNPYLDYGKICEIAKARDDSLEMPDNAPARLSPGAYNLVLLDADTYIIQGSAGDEAALEITRQEGSSQAINLKIIDQAGVSVWQQHLVEAESPIGFHLKLENPPYTLSITQADYETDPNIYSLGMDFQGAYVQQVPYIPKNGPWSGFALTNGSEDEVVEVMLVTYGSAGQPLQTVLGPMDLGPSEKHVVQFSDLPLRLHEYTDTVSLKLISDQPVDMVNLFAGASGPMAGFASDLPAGRRLIIPDVYANELGDPAFMKGALANESFFDADILCSLYSAEGALTHTISQHIEARGRLEIRPGSSPFYDVPDEGWVEILADNPEAGLTGYQYVSIAGTRSNTLDTLFALKEASGSIYVQHVTLPEGPWRSRLTLINSNGHDNPVIIHPDRNGKNSLSDMKVTMAPFEKKVIDLSKDFGDAAHRSILKISGDYPLAGYVAYIEKNGDSTSYPLLTDESFKPELIMPHAAYGKGQWFTGVGICNPNAFPVTVLVLPYGQNGQPMEAAGDYLSIEAGAYEIFTVHQKFLKFVQDIAFLKIRTEDPDTAEIGGFYLIGNSTTAQNPKPATLVSGGNM